MSDEGPSQRGSESQPGIVSVTASVPTKASKLSSFRAKLGHHRGTSKSTNTIPASPTSSSSANTAPRDGVSRAPDTPTTKQHLTPSASHRPSSEKKPYTIPEGSREKVIPSLSATDDNPLAPHVRLVIVSIATTGLVTIVLSRLHWTLSIIAVGTTSYIVSKMLISRGEDLAFANRIANNEDRWTKGGRVESVEWINHILGVVWPLITMDIFMPFIDLLEDALQLQVPGIVHAVRVEDVDQGVIPLKIEKFKILGRGEDDFLGKRHDQAAEQGTVEEGNEEHPDLGEHVNLEVDFFYRAPPQSRKGFTVMTSNAMEEGIGPKGEDSSKTVETPSSRSSAEMDNSDTPAEMIHMLLYLSVGLQKIAAVEVPVWCEVLGIQGKMRLRVQLVPNAPFVKHVGFTLMGQPKLELKAKPLGRKMIIDAMQLPFLSSYVLKSVQTTVAPFVCPSSYTIDVAALLGAEAGPKNTYSVGVICVILHQASDLPAADTNGYSDPFVSVSFARAGKPLFRSRVLRRTLRPTWQEVVYVPVSLDEIRDHEKLRFTIFDADRFSADDPLGKVEVSIDHLIHRALQRSKDFKSSTMMETRTDDLQPVQRGGQAKGQLKYSIVFSKLVQPDGGDGVASTPRRARAIHQAALRARQMDQRRNKGKDDEKEEAEKMVKGQEQEDGDEDVIENDPPTKEEVEALAAFETGFDRFVRSLGVPMDKSLLKARKARHERVRKLVSTLSGEQAAIMSPPDPAWPTGILAFHVHSIQQLEVSQTQRSYKTSNITSSGSMDAFNASGGAGDQASATSSRTPSSYVQIFMNDEPLLKTRTKTYNARPFINAGSERVVGDFRTARMDFVVRDSRQREGDPILGIVGLKVADVLKASARKTDWYTLTGGLGYGKMQITLLWRSIQLQVPASLRGWNLGVLELTRLQASVSRMFEGKEGYFSLQTPGGKAELGGISGKVQTSSKSDTASAAEYPLQFEVDFSSQSIRLPVRQRYPGHLVITLKSGTRTPGRRRPQAVLCTPLSRLVDNAESSFRVPLWVSNDWYNVEQGILKATSADRQLFEGGREESAEEVMQVSALEELCMGSLGDLPEELRYDGGTMHRAGFVDLTLYFFPGIAEEHQPLLGGDHELRYAHEAWQSMVDCKERPLPRRAGRGGGGGVSRPRERSTSSAASTGAGANAAGSSLYEPSVLDLHGDDEDVAGDDVESDEERKLRRRIQHRQERGAAQIKGYRTATWIKQNINDGIGRAKRLAGEQSKRLSKMEDEGVSSI